MAFFGLTALGKDDIFGSERLSRLTAKDVQEFHLVTKTKHAVQ